MDEPILLSRGNLVVVAKNPPGKPFHEGGDAFILDPNHADGVLCQFVLGGKKVVSPQRILREKNIDTVSRQRACDKVSRPSLLSTHHSSKRQTNATEKRASTTIIRPVYQKLIESDCWEQKKGNIDKHPMLSYLKSGRQKECGWLRKEEATALNKKSKVHLDHDERSLMIKIQKCTQKLTSCKSPSRYFSPTADLAYAFGVKENVVRTCVTKELKNNGSNKRKQRTDAGETLFNSNKKRDQVWTSRQYYTKLQNKINEGDTIPRHEINQRFDNLSDEKKTNTKQEPNE